MIRVVLIGKDFEGGGGELINTVCSKSLALKSFLYDFDGVFMGGSDLFIYFVRFSICLTLRRLMSCMYGAPILDVSRSHTTTQHSR